MRDLWTSLSAARRAACLALPPALLLAIAVLPGITAARAVHAIAIAVACTTLLIVALAGPGRPSSEGEDDGDGGGGGPPPDDPEPEGPGPADDGALDWARFEREFRAYAAEHTPAERP
jgi:hypothetical protein